MIGAYAIICTVTGKRYIGSSTYAISSRMSNHKTHLNRGTHANKPLQEEYTRHGPLAFVFRSYEHADPRAKEQSLITYWMRRGLCYNRHPSALSGRGFKMDPNPQRAIRAKARCTLEWRASVSARVRRQHARKQFGQHTWSDETKRETYRKIGDALRGKPGGRKGKKATPEQRERYRKAALKREAKKRRERKLKN